MRKILRVCLEEGSLFKEAEGCGFQGWSCPVWATIHHGEDHDVMTFSLGAPVSSGATFYPNTMHMGGVKCWNRRYMGWVECWNRRYSEDDAEMWAKDMRNEGCEVGEEDFDCGLELDAEVDSADLSYLRMDIMSYVSAFAEEEGYDEVEEI